ncbi:microprocessor complex subunit DGCR8 [Ditylenchus destructor]|nr:microprocessor complex subunit DGCR8 [Ditylenchus destructor]
MKSQLTPDELYEYVKKAFKTKNICVYRFQKWTDARNFYKDKKRCANERMAMLGISKDTLRPTLPGGVKLITVPSFDHASKPQQRGFYLNPRGKTSKLRDSVTLCRTPGCDEQSQRQILIGYGVEYITLGEGYGNSIKLGKLTAARKAVENLIPGKIVFAEDGTGGVKREEIKVQSILSISGMPKALGDFWRHGNQLEYAKTSPSTAPFRAEGGQTHRPRAL